MRRLFPQRNNEREIKEGEGERGRERKKGFSPNRRAIVVQIVVKRVINPGETKKKSINIAKHVLKRERDFFAAGDGPAAKETESARGPRERTRDAPTNTPEENDRERAAFSGGPRREREKEEKERKVS